SMNGTRVFAPSVAGVLAGVSTIGIGGAYLISAVCSAVSFVFLLRLPREDRAVVADRAVRVDRAPSATGVTVPPEPAPRPRPVGSPLTEIRAGIGYVLARPQLRRLIISSFFVIMFGFNYVAFYPALVKGEFGLGDAWVGLISSASAVGAVVVALPLAAKADSSWARVAMVCAGLSFGLGVVGFGLAGSFWWAFGVICFIGAATTVYQSLSNTLAMAMTDDSHHGRVQSLMQLSFAGFGIAALPLGGLAEWIGLRPTIVIMGSIATAAVAFYGVTEGGWVALRPARRSASIDQGPADTVVDHDVDLAGTPAAGA
ncbi:MAG: MFS transporter, partial [Acidimicrobiia bacterium]|nr:MFS transporter [Acidimicrobiia bacterium]